MPYMVLNGRGEMLLDGLEDHEAARAAMQMAKTLNESVKLVPYYVAVNGDQRETPVLDGPGSIIPP